jgi:ribonucleotide monophosphatase NagD (HAD superfamily)
MVLLVDIDGVLKNGMEKLSGTSTFFKFIEKRPDLKVTLLSNSTMLTGEEVGLFFGNQLPNKVKVLTALDVAINYSKTCESIKVYCLPEAIKHFDDKKFSNQPQTLIIGDIGENWNYDTMNEIFTHIKEGSELVAIQMNKYGIKNGS